MPTLVHPRAVRARSVIDVGIGGARYAEGYVECEVETVTGGDMSSTMLQFARQHARAIPGHETAFKFVLSDIEQFETDETLDVVVAMGFLDCVTNAPATAKLLRR